MADRNSRRRRSSRASSGVAPHHYMQQIGEHKTELIVSDMDLTMTAAFWAGWCASMWELIPKIAKLIGFEGDLDEITRELGRVIKLRGTHEHPWLLEESWIRTQFKGTPEEFREQIAKPFWDVQDRKRARYAEPYPFVTETLVALKQAGIRVAILSDAPMYTAMARARACNFDQLVDGLYALSSDNPDELKISPEDAVLGRQRVLEGEAMPHRFDVVKVLPKKTHEKPSPLGLRMVMEDFGIKDPKKVLFIGDSLPKDGGVAQAVGCPFLWAQYGHYSLMPRDRNLADVKFNPECNSVKPKNMSYPPMVASLACYADLLRYLGRVVMPAADTILPPSAMGSAIKGGPS